MKKSRSREAEKNITIQYLLDRYDFDLESGHIFLKSNRKRADKIHHFRSNSNSRYRQVQVPDPSQKGATWIKISAHRMIWAVANGRWPLEGMDIDHLDSNTSNNSINNLEEVEEAENIRRGISKKQKARQVPQSKANVMPSKLCSLGRLKLRTLADAANSEAAFALGQLYQLGIEVNQNDDEAIYWYRFAAQLGHKRAEECVNEFYKN